MQVSIKEEFDPFVSTKAAAPEFGSAEEYINELVSRELRKQRLGWDWLREQLRPGMEAEESEFKQVSAEDVINRNTGRQD